MALVNVMVNGRAYTIACDDGEEEHLRGLAGHVDAKAREVLESIGQVGDTRLMLMAALLIADERHDILAKLESTARQADAESATHAELHLRADRSEGVAADKLEAAARKLEELAERLE
jgi:cell division protein ZapA